MPALLFACTLGLTIWAMFQSDLAQYIPLILPFMLYSLRTKFLKRQQAAGRDAMTGVYLGWVLGMILGAVMIFGAVWKVILFLPVFVLLALIGPGVTNDWYWNRRIRALNPEGWTQTEPHTLAEVIDEAPFRLESESNGNVVFNNELAAEFSRRRAGRDWILQRYVNFRNARKLRVKYDVRHAAYPVARNPKANQVATGGKKPIIRVQIDLPAGSNTIWAGDRWTRDTMNELRANAKAELDKSEAQNVTYSLMTESGEILDKVKSLDDVKHALYQVFNPKQNHLSKPDVINAVKQKLPQANRLVRQDERNRRRGKPK